MADIGIAFPHRRTWGQDCGRDVAEREPLMNFDLGIGFYAFRQRAISLYTIYNQSRRVDTNGISAGGMG